MEKQKQIGFWLLASAWSVLYTAQQTATLATTGAYSFLRHPQYLAFIIIMPGFLLQWPTLPTLIMFPILVYFYVRLPNGKKMKRLHSLEMSIGSICNRHRHSFRIFMNN